MSQRLPIGIQTFRKIIEEEFLYVDKTEYLYRLLTSSGYFFLARPRRFGKSLTLSTIKEIYMGSRELFQGLWIESRWDWQKIHPVIHFSFGSIGYRTIGLEAAIEAELRQIGQQAGVEFEQVGITRIFRELIQKLAINGKVAILIDEYDKPLIDYLDDKPQARANQQMLKSFYSVLKDSDPYIEFLLLTGVSKFSKVSIFSDLNNLKDITFHRDFAALTGYTQDEVERYFGDTITQLAAEKGQSHAELMLQIRTWYNGYSWDGDTQLYNPFSFMSFVDSGDFRNFWFETGTPTFLPKLMRENGLYAIDDLEVSELSFASYDIERLQILPILFQTGYLTIKARLEYGLYRLGYPNREVESSMLMYLIGEMSHSEPTLTTPTVVRLYKAFLHNDLEQVIRLIKGIFKTIPSQLFIADAEAYYHSLIYLVFFYLGQYTHSEVNTSDGRLDCVVESPTHIYILEFKLDQRAEVALKQIKQRGYHEMYATDPRPKVLLGVNFSRQTKTVDEWLAETV